MLHQHVTRTFPDPTSTEASGARLSPLLIALPWATMLGLLIGWALAPGALEAHLFAPLLLSVVVLGLPHGALDHLVPGRLGWSWGRRPGPTLLYCLAYAVLAASVLLAWRLAPLPTFWGFLAVSLLHWGQGDLHFLESALGRRRPARWSALLAILARGSLTMLVPLLAFPEYFERLARGAALAFGAPAPAGALLSRGERDALLLGCAALLAGYVLDTLRAARSPARLGLELGETALLLALFLWVPAPLAIGAYFALWHAPRHLGRLLVLRPADAARVARGRWLRPAARLARDLLPLTGVALVTLGVLYAVNAGRVTSTKVFAALYLALIAALTLPHAVVVALMDLPPRS